MLKTILSSFLLAFHNIRSHFFHTLLSVLGIVIGVAALVSILSLIDGLEGFAKEQITKTTSLNAISIQPQLFSQTNDVRIRKDTFSVLQFGDYEDLNKSLPKPASIHYMTSFAGTGTFGDPEKQFGAVFFALGSPKVAPGVELLKGDSYTAQDISSASPLALVNLSFVKVIDSTKSPESYLGQELIVRGKTLRIKGVFDDKSKSPHVAFPLTLLTPGELRADPPGLTIEAEQVTDVPALKAHAEQWIRNRFRDAGDFSVGTNELRVQQAMKGFQLFRIVMGLIVGISVVVGGIGIMNVLLISITERTVEIGIRKAVGANRRDIILQFLAESVTVSVFGSAMGLIFGVLGTMAAVPIISAITEINFYAEYTWNTLLIVSVMAVLLGIVFGTYPALRASRLDPVEAIRHE